MGRIGAVDPFHVGEVMVHSKPTNIDENFTGAEVFELVRAAINEQVVQATNEVARLTRMVKYDMAHAVEDASDVYPSIPGSLYGLRLENQIALQSARAQLAAVKQVWLSVNCAVTGPYISATTQEAVVLGMSQFLAKQRVALDLWRAKRDPECP